MVYWVWLQKILGFGSDRVHEVLETFGSARAMYEAGADAVRAAGILPPAALKKIGAVSLAECKATVNICKNMGIHIITPDTPQYPKALLNTQSPPAVLYTKGKLPDFDNTPSFCIVGPRECTDFSKKAAFSLAYRLSLGGMIIISGGAKGADYYAHTGALRADGITVLVMPCGIDIEYPAANKDLRKAVLQKGCLISEFPPGYNVTKGAFYTRNRILSGLALGVAVVEAHDQSGALITANHALEQGREVFVVPARQKNDEHFAGSDKLLEDGAIPLVSALNIFEHYYPVYPEKINMRKAYNVTKQEMADDYESIADRLVQKIKKTKLFKPKKEKTSEFLRVDLKVLTEKARRVYECFEDKELSVDEIFIEDISNADVFAALSELELYGLIQALPGGRFAKKELTV